MARKQANRNKYIPHLSFVLQNNFSANIIASLVNHMLQSTYWLTKHQSLSIVSRYKIAGFLLFNKKIIYDKHLENQRRVCKERSQRWKSLAQNV